MPWKILLPLGGTIPFVWGNKAAGKTNKASHFQISLGHFIIRREIFQKCPTELMIVSLGFGI